jgi:hypothetical protein
VGREKRGEGVGGVLCGEGWWLEDGAEGGPNVVWWAISETLDGGGEGRRVERRWMCLREWYVVVHA